VSRDGHRLRIATPSPRAGRPDVEQIDLETCEVSAAGHVPARALEPLAAHYCSRLATHNLRRALEAVGYAPDGHRLVLNPRRDVLFVLEMSRGWMRLVRRSRSELFVARLVDLVPSRAPPGTRYGLRSARFADGSRVSMDGRGLVHLRSSDPAVPEMSLVLADGAVVSGWASDGSVCGDRYFTGDGSLVPPAEFLARVAEFVSRLR
jgi:hypothetical protein